jgi:hypothetical protein
MLSRSGARKAAASAPMQRAGESVRGIRGMFTDDDDGSLNIEAFMLTLVRAVRDDEQVEERNARDVYVTARKRRRRLALMSFGAGPLVGVANQFADLYCETAVVCDVAALHDLNLSDEQIGAHMLLLWELTNSLDAAQKSIAGEPPVATILASKLGERAGEQLPDELTKRSVTKALWDVRGTLGDARKGATTGAVKTVMFTGHRTKKVIKKTEAQLGVKSAQERFRRFS